MNNKPRKRSKQRVSMIAKQHQEQVEIAKWSEKAVHKCLWKRRMLMVKGLNYVERRMDKCYNNCENVYFTEVEMNVRKEMIEKVRG